MGKHKSSLAFDPIERVEFVKGFVKRKQERKEAAIEKKKELDRKMKSLLRQKRKEALEKAYKQAIGQFNEDTESIQTNE